MSKHDQFLDKYHQYIVQNSDWNDNVVEYLQGGNKELYGTILGFKKGWRNSEVVKNDFYSVLLFFDHTTARIERYLVNKGVKQGIDIVRIDEVVDPALHVDQFDEEKNKIIRPIYTTPYNIPAGVSFHHLHDGKLNKAFFQVFLFELFRDYLHTHKSYRIPNMNIIRTWTDPSEYRENEETKMGLGSGEVIPRNAWHTINTHNTPVDVYLKTSEASRIIKFGKDQPQKIYVPKNFHTVSSTETFSNFGYNLEPYNPKFTPKVIKDIKTILNAKNFSRLNVLDLSIEKFNYVVARKIHNINNNIKNNKKFYYSEELMTYRMEKNI